MKLSKAEGELLFVTPVWRLQYDEFEAVNRAIVAEMDAVDWTQSHARRGLTELVENRYREDVFITLELVPSAKVVVRAFGHACLEIARELGWDLSNNEIRIASLWAHLTEPGRNTQLHNHHPAHLSCAYYVSTTPDSGAIKFVDDRMQRILEPESTTGHEFCRRNVEIAPRDGLMVVFPSWVGHLVGENRTDQRRVSLSMNAKVVPVGEAAAVTGVRVDPSGELDI